MENKSHYVNPVDAVESALRDKHYLDYFTEETPLLWTELAVEDQSSPEVLESLELLGWPEEGDAEMDPVHIYRTPQEFYVALFNAHEDESKDLNNFLAHFRAKDVSVSDLGVGQAEAPGSIEDMYGRAPYFLRAKAVAPDLIKGLQASLGTVRGEALRDKLQQNQSLNMGLYAAYRLMGRLMKPSDGKLQMELSYPQMFTDKEADVNVITDAHKALIQ